MYSITTKSILTTFLSFIRAVLAVNMTITYFSSWYTLLIFCTIEQSWATLYKCTVYIVCGYVYTPYYIALVS